MKRIPSTAHLRLFSSSLRLSLALGVVGVFATAGFGAGKDTAASKDTYYLNDHLATTVATSDAAGEIAQIEADAFGTQEGPVAKDSRFTGKPYDADMGAYVFPFRNYRPEEARWMSADPSGFPDGVNSSSYALNPVSMLDPTGLATLSLIVNSSFGNNGVYYIPAGQQSISISGMATVTFKVGTVPSASTDFSTTGSITTSLYGASSTAKTYTTSGSGTVHSDATSNTLVDTLNLTLDSSVYSAGSYTLSLTSSATTIGGLAIGSTTNSFSFRVIQE